MIERNFILSMALPDIADIAAASKRKKRERDLLTSSYNSLLSVTDIEFTDTKTPQAVKECWLVSKFWLQKIIEAREDVIRIPKNITEAQKKEMLCNVAYTLASAFDYLLTETRSSPPILTPPTRVCHECGKSLVSNHKTKVNLLLACVVVVIY